VAEEEPSRPHLRVAAALLEREGKLLLARRGPGGPCAGLWEFPGGKCHEGEELSECLAREMAEELDLAVEVGALVDRVEHDYGRYTVTLHLLRVSSAGEPRAVGCAEWSWVRPADVPGLNLAPADRRLVDRILSGVAGAATEEGLG